jgi:hypothetical protein
MFRYVITPSEESHIRYQNIHYSMDKQSCVVLAAVFLIAGTLLATTAITTMVPAAYADNKNKAEDDSAAAIADCDHNEVERAGFDCFGIAVNDLEIEEESNGPPG